MPDADALRGIYGPDYFSDQGGEIRGQGYRDYESEEQNHRANAVARLRLLERHQQVGALLDVGCAAGFFLDEARGRGWGVEGVELADEMAARARSRLGLDVHALAFDQVELQPGRFDVVTMWDYIEHTVDPVGDLERAAMVLRRGGILALSTGDAASVVARISGRRWHLLTPRHHNFFFTRESLEQALGRAGFEIVEVRYSSSLYSLQYLVHKLRTVADWRLISWLATSVPRSRFGSTAVPLNLFDIVTVVGRRR